MRRSKIAFFLYVASYPLLKWYSTMGNMATSVLTAMLDCGTLDYPVEETATIAGLWAYSSNTLAQVECHDVGDYLWLITLVVTTVLFVISTYRVLFQALTAVLNSSVDLRDVSCVKGVLSWQARILASLLPEAREHVTMAAASTGAGKSTTPSLLVDYIKLTWSDLIPLKLYARITNMPFISAPTMHGSHPLVPNLSYSFQ